MAAIFTTLMLIIVVAQDMLPSVMDGNVSLAPYLTIGFWLTYGLPLLLVVPLATFLAGVTSASPAKRFGYARTLALLCLCALPVSGVLGGLELSPPRYRSIQHPPMYWTEVVMFVVPFVSFSVMITIQRWRHPTESPE